MEKFLPLSGCTAKSIIGRIKNSKKKYFWLDVDGAGASTVTFRVTATVNMGGCGIDFMAYRFDAAGEGFITEVGTVNNSTPTCTYTPPVSGYYAFSYQWNGTGTPTPNSSFCFFTMGISNTGSSVMGHHAIQGFENEYQNIDAIRLGGVSMKYAERASDLNTQGEIIGAQCNGSFLWTNFLRNGFTTATSQRLMKKLPIKNGFYGWIKPTDIDQLSYEKFPLVKDNTNTCDGCCTYLDDTAPYIAFYAKVVSDPGKDGYIECNYGTEFLTNTKWRTYGQARFGPDTFQTVLYMLDQVDQFHENPKHVSEIWEALKSMVKDTADGILEYGPKFKELMAKMA